MCTVVFLRRPGDDWPLLLAANRDEMDNRPWKAPARHWPTRPEVVAGLDELAGGSWLGLNDFGVVAGILNRRGTLGPAPGARSRGELVLEALDHADAVAAAAMLAYLDPRAWRAFNLFVADNRDAFWIKSLGPEGPVRVEVTPIPDGLSMLTAFDLDDATDPRMRRYLPLFRKAPVPDPEAGDWQGWETLLRGRESAEASLPQGAMCFALANGFGTRSSSLLALPAPGGGPSSRPIWRFAAGPPDQAAFTPITI